MKINEFYRALLPLLPNAEHEILWLLSHYLDLPKSQLFLDREREISAEEAAKISDAVQRRAAGEPLQYITGLQPFWDFELIVSPDVLIPRWDSEVVIERALELLPQNDSAKAIKAADICTGSGAYALAIKHSRPAISLTATDISEAALKIARQNAAKYDLEIEFLQGDLLAALPHEQKYDLIVSNPPYIKEDAELPDDVLQEPHLALFGGKDGLNFYRRLAAEAGEHLLPGGYILLEIGCEQAHDVGALLNEAGFTNIQIGQDLAGLDRWVSANFCL
jgi:release factor glutamine methyltransferase